MLLSILVWNPWVLFDDSFLALGLDQKQWNVLIISLMTLLLAGLCTLRSSGEFGFSEHMDLVLMRMTLFMEVSEMKMKKRNYPLIRTISFLLILVTLLSFWNKIFAL